MPTQVAEIVAERARRLGPIPFDEVVDLALYHPEHGFYSTGGGAGRGGDFLTSPEVGPLFGVVLARALDDWWRDMGEPDPYVVVEAGAGAGGDRAGAARGTVGVGRPGRLASAAAAPGYSVGPFGPRRSRAGTDHGL